MVNEMSYGNNSSPITWSGNDKLLHLSIEKNKFYEKVRGRLARQVFLKKISGKK